MLVPNANPNAAASAPAVKMASKGQNESAAKANLGLDSSPRSAARPSYLVGPPPAAQSKVFARELSFVSPVGTPSEVLLMPVLF